MACLFVLPNGFLFIVAVPTESTEQIGGPGRSHLISIPVMSYIMCTHLVSHKLCFAIVSTQSECKEQNAIKYKSERLDVSLVLKEKWS